MWKSFLNHMVSVMIGNCHVFHPIYGDKTLFCILLYSSLFNELKDISCTYDFIALHSVSFNFIEMH